MWSAKSWSYFGLMLMYGITINAWQHYCQSFLARIARVLLKVHSCPNPHIWSSLASAWPLLLTLVMAWMAVRLLCSGNTNQARDEVQYSTVWYKQHNIMGKYQAHGAPAQHWVITDPPLQQLDSTSHRFQLSIRLFSFWSLLPFVHICVLGWYFSCEKSECWNQLSICFFSFWSLLAPMCWIGISSWKIWTLKFVFGRAGSVKSVAPTFNSLQSLIDFIWKFTKKCWGSNL